MGDELPYRLAVAAILAVNLAISGRFRRRARDVETIERRAEGLPLILGRLALVVPGLLLLGTYLVAPDRLAWARLDLPTWLRVGGGLLGLATVPMNVWILASIGANISETVLTKESHRLVDHGPYARVRHPLYTSGLAMLLALSLLAANWAMLALTTVAGIVIAAVVVPREERELERRFGGAYADYRRQTGAFLPRPGHRSRVASAGRRDLP